jgi:outer membrane protein OmpA-like peptidoglycan-associated protein
MLLKSVLLPVALLAGGAGAAAQQAAPPLQPDPYADAPEGAHVDVGPFIVFFEPSSSSLDLQAAEVLGSFIGLVQHGHADPPLIVVTGAADRTGSAAGNLKLSCQRAKAVRRWLLSNGLGQRNIAAVGVGETQPLVATRDGEAEAQNRSATVGISEGLERPPEGGLLCSNNEDA